ncbi:MAG: hypothetical protein E5Y56_25085 [Mesorhizobium sp.]|nr:MAG: hypothetical protein E5Y56_25085 [Mesorhizobium sp.]
MRGAPAWHRRQSVQHPSSVSALRANPPSPTRGEGKKKAPAVLDSARLPAHVSVTLNLEQ